MVLFELGVIILTLAFLLILYRFDNHIWKKYLIIFIGILLFQYFTQALWLTVGLESWAYLYLGVSWIITLGRATMVIVSIALIDLYFRKTSERGKFWLYLVLITILGLVAEAIAAGSGTIQYHPALQELFSGVTLIGSVPIEALFYIPVFMAYVLAFYKYWEKRPEIKLMKSSRSKPRRKRR